MISHRILLFLGCREYLLVFLVCFFFLSLLQLHPSFPDPDSFYHARIAVEMLKGPVVSFSALPFTVLADTFIDHHFLYHIFLLPFVSAFDPLVGLKIATVFSAAGFITFFYWLLRTYARCGRALALCFLLFLVLNIVFLFRINLAKIPAVSLLVFFSGLVAIIKNRPAHVFGLSFLYVWLYGGWPLLPISSVIAWGVQWIKTHREQSPLKGIRSELTVLFVSLSGALTGLIINPYFPTNIVFTWIQTFKIALLNILTEVPVGGEWYPPGLSFIPAHGPTLTVLIFSTIAVLSPRLFAAVFRTEEPTRSWREWFLFVLTLCFLALTLKSRRYGEYFAPLAVLFSASILTPILSRDILSRFWGFVKNALAHPRTVRGVITIYLGIAAIAVLFINGSHIIASYTNGFSFTHYARGMAWIKEHVPEQSLIFHHRWDDFPLFYYHAPRYRYISGLDARFLYEKDSDRAERYTTLSLGADLDQTFGYRDLCTAALSTLQPTADDSPTLYPLCCTPSQEALRAADVIRLFSPSAIVMTNHDSPLQEKIRDVPGFDEVYRDDEMVIFTYGEIDNVN